MLEVGVRAECTPSHSDTINACKFSKDGAHLLTVSNDGHANVYSTDNGRLVATLHGHTGELYACDYASDDRVVTAGADSIGKLWRVKYKRMSPSKGPIIVHAFQSLTGHTSSIYSCLFLHDGNTIVTASADNTARLWNSQSGLCLHVLDGHLDYVSSCTASRCGTHVATGSKDATVRVWDTMTGNTVNILRGHESTVTHCHFSSDGKHVLTGALDGTAKLWNYTTSSDSLVTYAGHERYITSCSFSSRGSRVLTSSADTTARIYDTLSGTCLVVLMGHTKNVMSAKFVLEDKYVVTSSTDNNLILWTSDGGESVSLFSTGFSGLPTCFDVSPSGEQLAATSWNNSAMLYAIPDEFYSSPVISSVSDLIISGYLANHPNEHLLSDIVDQLDQLIGLNSVKCEIINVLTQLLVRKVPTERLCFMFEGPMGAGKRTVTTLLGKLLVACGAATETLETNLPARLTKDMASQLHESIMKHDSAFMVFHVTDGDSSDHSPTDETMDAIEVLTNEMKRSATLSLAVVMPRGSDGHKLKSSVNFAFPYHLGFYSYTLNQLVELILAKARMCTPPLTLEATPRELVQFLLKNKTSFKLGSRSVDSLFVKVKESRIRELNVTDLQTFCDPPNDRAEEPFHQESSPKVASRSPATPDASRPWSRTSDRTVIATSSNSSPKPLLRKIVLDGSSAEVEPQSPETRTTETAHASSDIPGNCDVIVRSPVNTNTSSQAVSYSGGESPQDAEKYPKYLDDDVVTSSTNHPSESSILQNRRSSDMTGTLIKHHVDALRFGLLDTDTEVTSRGIMETTPDTKKDAEIEELKKEVKSLNGQVSRLKSQLAATSRSSVNRLILFAVVFFILLLMVILYYDDATTQVITQYVGWDSLVTRYN